MARISTNLIHWILHIIPFPLFSDGGESQPRSRDHEEEESEETLVAKVRAPNVDYKPDIYHVLGDKNEPDSEVR